MRSPVELYIAEIRDIRGSAAGTDETSYYGALASLFNEVGKTLSPRIHAVMQLRDGGAGNPDGGFFTENQVRAGVARSVSEKARPLKSGLP